MKKILISLIILFIGFLPIWGMPLKAKVVRVQGQVFLNHHALKINEEILLHENDTVTAFSGSQIRLEIETLCQLWIKDSSQLVIQNLQFQLKIGLLRFQVPEQTPGEEKSFRISTGSLITSVMQGHSRRDMAVRVRDDTTLIAVYEGDSLSITRRNQGEKGLEYLNIPEFKGMTWVMDQVKEWFDLSSSILNPGIWGRDLEHVSYLMERQEIDQASLDLEEIILTSPLGADYVQANLQMAYLLLYDNLEQQALEYMNKVIKADPGFQLPSDYTSPKIENIYHQALKIRDESRPGRGSSAWLRQINPFVPGLPQLRAGKTLKGYALLSADVALWGGFLYHYNRQDHFLNLANRSVTQADVDRYYDRSIDHYHSKQIFFYSALGIHVLNAMDYYFFDRPQRLSVQVENQTVYCRMAFRF